MKKVAKINKSKSRVYKLYKRFVGNDDPKDICELWGGLLLVSLFWIAVGGIGIVIFSYYVYTIYLYFSDKPFLYEHSLGFWAITSVTLWITYDNTKKRLKNFFCKKIEYTED